MKVKILPSEISGKITVPSSKSYTHRALICSALAKGKSKIISPSECDDTEVMVKNLEELGINIEKKRRIWKVESKDLKKPKKELFCGESATTLRFLTALCSLIKGRCKLTGGPSLLKRPVQPLIKALRQLGAKCWCKGEFPPVITNDNYAGGNASLPGNISSQFISALLLIAPLGKKETNINITTPLESRPYIKMTLTTQEKFGIEIKFLEICKKFTINPQVYKPTTYLVESDWSSAAILLAAGALAGKVKISQLNLSSFQPDKIILDVLREMRAKIKINDKNVIVEKSKLKPIKFNVSDCPDLFPVLAALCANANGISEIKGIERLKFKESNRVEAMKEGLERMGINTIEKNNKLIIKGSKPKGAEIDCKNDHRIAMTFGILGLAAKGETIITNGECVSKSFPSFWETIKKVGGNIDYE